MCSRRVSAFAPTLQRVLFPFSPSTPPRPPPPEQTTPPAPLPPLPAIHPQAGFFRRAKGACAVREAITFAPESTTGHLRSALRFEHLASSSSRLQVPLHPPLRVSEPREDRVRTTGYGVDAFEFTALSQVPPTGELPNGVLSVFLFNFLLKCLGLKPLGDASIQLKIINSESLRATRRVRMHRSIELVRCSWIKPESCIGYTYGYSIVQRCDGSGPTNANDQSPPNQQQDATKTPPPIPPLPAASLGLNTSDTPLSGSQSRKPTRGRAPREPPSLNCCQCDFLPLHLQQRSLELNKFIQLLLSHVAASDVVEVTLAVACREFL